MMITRVYRGIIYSKTLSYSFSLIGAIEILLRLFSTKMARSRNEILQLRDSLGKAVESESVSKFDVVIFILIPAQARNSCRYIACT
jgi:hypothetical protein